VPRAVFLHWPLGHPLGEPHNRLQQETVLFHALRLLVEGDEPGILAEPGLRWRREKYVEPDWATLTRP
jgi:hypothetical protein